MWFGSSGPYSGGAQGSGYGPDYLAPFRPFDQDVADDHVLALPLDNKTPWARARVVSRGRMKRAVRAAAILLALPVLVAEVAAAAPKRPVTQVIDGRREAKPRPGNITVALPRRNLVAADPGRALKPAAWQPYNNRSVKRVTAAVRFALPVLVEESAPAITRKPATQIVSRREGLPRNGRTFRATPTDLPALLHAATTVVSGRRDAKPRGGTVALVLPRRNLQTPDPGRSLRPAVWQPQQRPTKRWLASARAILPVLAEEVLPAQKLPLLTKVVAAPKPPRPGRVLHVQPRDNLAPLAVAGQASVTSRAKAKLPRGAVLTATRRRNLEIAVPITKPIQALVITRAPVVRPGTVVVLLPVLAEESAAPITRRPSALVLGRRDPKPHGGSVLVALPPRNLAPADPGRTLRPAVWQPQHRPVKRWLASARVVVPSMVEEVLPVGTLRPITMVVGTPRPPHPGRVLHVQPRDNLAPLAVAGQSYVVSRAETRPPRGPAVFASPRRNLVQPAAPLAKPRLVLAVLDGSSRVRPGRVVVLRHRGPLVVPTAFPELCIEDRSGNRYTITDRTVNRFAITETTTDRYTLHVSDDGRYEIEDASGTRYPLTLRPHDCND